MSDNFDLLLSNRPSENYSNEKRVNFVNDKFYNTQDELLIINEEKKEEDSNSSLKYEDNYREFSISDKFSNENSYRSSK